MSDRGNGVEFTDEDGNGIVTSADLKAMRQQRDLERSRAESAETARQQAERERDEARGTAGNEIVARIASEEQAITSAIASAEAEAEAVEGRIAQLNAEGSFAEAAKAHRLLARAEARIENLTMRAEYVKGQRAFAEQQQAEAAKRPTVTNNGMTAKQNAWIRAHPDFNTDPVYTARVNAEHNLCVADGVTIDSDEYFERIDGVATRSGATNRNTNGNDRNGDDQDEAPLAPRRREAVQMPVTRRNADTGRRSDGPVRLSPEERESADVSYPDIPIDDYVDGGETQPGRYRLYAIHKQRLRAAGRMP
jgi:hypothetical protein